MFYLTQRCREAENAEESTIIYKKIGNYKTIPLFMFITFWVEIDF